MARSFTQLNFSKSPVWPSISIVLLMVTALFFPPGLITGMNVYLLILASFAWFYSSKKISPNMGFVLIPFLIVLAIGFANGIDADRYLYLKDAWYISNPPIIICTGCVLYFAKPDMVRGLRAFVIGGSVIAAMYLSSFVMQPDLILQSSVKIRETIGTGYYAPSLALTILFAYFKNWKNGLALPTWGGGVCFILCLLAAMLCFSRTVMIVTLVGCMSALGFFAKKELQHISLVGAAAAVILIVLNLSLDVSDREVQHTFAGKLARSMDEISVQEYTDFKSINENWRGFETARALKLYCAGNPFQWLFGYGFGQQVDLGLAMPLGSSAGGEGTLKRYIPILHNGYAYLLVKGGAMSVLLYIYVLAYLYLVGRKIININPAEKMASSGKVLQGISVSLAVTTWLVSGAFNKLDMFPYLLAAGFLLAAIPHSYESNVNNKSS